MKNPKDKPGEPESVKEVTTVDAFVALYPEIFTFFKAFYVKRKSELKTKLENRPTKAEKEALLADERKRETDNLESHPLFGVYQLLSKPFTEMKTFVDRLLPVMTQAINAGATSETDLKAKEVIQFIVEKCIQQANTPNIANFNSLMKKLAEIPESTEAIKSIANSNDALASFGYHVIKMEGDNQYIKYVIKTYEELQEGKIKTVESKREIEKIHFSSPQKDQGDLESLIQNSVRQVLSEQTAETKEPIEEILSVEQASQYLNLAKQTIYGFTSKNEIPFFKRGKKLYFKKSELEQWLFEGKQKTIKETQKEAIAYVNKKKK